MKILQVLPRHCVQLEALRALGESHAMKDYKYICVVIDGPDSSDRRLSWASSFDDEDTHKVFQWLADQTRT